MDIDILRTELAGDPLARGYAGMSDTAAAADLNTIYRERNKTGMTGSEILNAVDTAEWNALDAAGKQAVWDVVHLSSINPFGVEATLLTAVFGGGSTTITALAAARKESISRATERGLPTIYEGHIQQARAI